MSSEQRGNYLNLVATLRNFSGSNVNWFKKALESCVGRKYQYVPYISILESLGFPQISFCAHALEALDRWMAGLTWASIPHTHFLTAFLQDMFCSLKKIYLEEDTWMIQSDIKQGDTRCIEKKNWIWRSQGGRSLKFYGEINWLSFEGRKVQVGLLVTSKTISCDWICDPHLRPKGSCGQHTRSDTKLQVPQAHQTLADHPNRSFQKRAVHILLPKQGCCPLQEVPIVSVLKRLLQTCPCSVCLPVRHCEVDRGYHSNLSYQPSNQVITSTEQNWSSAVWQGRHTLAVLRRTQLSRSLERVWGISHSRQSEAYAGPQKNI